MKKKHQREMLIFQTQCSEKWLIGLLSLLLIIFGVGGCGGTDDTTPSSESAIFVTLDDLPSPITIDVNPAEEVSINNLTIRGVNTIQEYRVTYFQFDGNPQVPPPFMMQVIPSMLTRGDDALTLQKVILLKQDALSGPPFTHLIETDETLTLGTVLELFGEDDSGNNVSAEATMVLVFSDS